MFTENIISLWQLILIVLIVLVIYTWAIPGLVFGIVYLLSMRDKTKRKEWFSGLVTVIIMFLLGPIMVWVFWRKQKIEKERIEKEKTREDFMRSLFGNIGNLG